MTTAFALVGIDGEVHAVVLDRQQLETHLANAEFDLGETIVEFDYNDAPMTERGKELAIKIQDLMKDVRKIHMNKQIGFYKIHIDDRLQAIYNLLTESREELDFEDFHWTNIDSFKVEHYQPSIEAELETIGICSTHSDTEPTKTS